MEVTYAFFCDAATVDAAGKANVLGIFGRISAAKFPATHLKMSFVFHAQFNMAEIGPKNVKFLFIDEDGKEIFKLEGPHEVTKEKLGCSFIVDLNNLTFEKPGTYAMHATINGSHVRSIPLILAQN